MELNDKEIQILGSLAELKLKFDFDLACTLTMSQYELKSNELIQVMAKFKNIKFLNDREVEVNIGFPNKRKEAKKQKFDKEFIGELFGFKSAHRYYRY